MNSSANSAYLMGDVQLPLHAFRNEDEMIALVLFYFLEACKLLLSRFSLAIPNLESGDDLDLDSIMGRSDYTEQKGKASTSSSERWERCSWSIQFGYYSTLKIDTAKADYQDLRTTVAVDRGPMVQLMNSASARLLQKWVLPGQPAEYSPTSMGRRDVSWRDTSPGI